VREHPTHPKTARTTFAVALAAVAVALGLSACGGGNAHATPTTIDSTATLPMTSTAGPTTAGPSTTLQGPSGSPANYPAAKPTPPSLAGAYPRGTTVDLITVLKTITAYGDWVASHPNPALVANYELHSGNAFAGETQFISQLQQLRLHATPTPTEIDYARVTLSPRPQAPLPSGQPRQLKGYQSFVGGIVTVVENNRPIAMLKADGQPSGHQFNPSHLGPTAYSISLVQGSDGRFRIDDSRQLDPPGGVASVEQS
jgi:hypothetical protein